MAITELRPESVQASPDKKINTLALLVQEMSRKARYLADALDDAAEEITCSSEEQRTLLDKVLIFAEMIKDTTAGCQKAGEEIEILSLHVIPEKAAT